MNKEWFSTNELAGAEGLPSTKQGVNQKARREKWVTRKRNGIQGKALEYHIDSLPIKSRDFLKANENNVVYGATNKDGQFSIWVAAYHQLTREEKDQLTMLIVRYGVTHLLKLVNETELEV